MYVLIHEAAHALDFSALRQWGSPFSQTQQWQGEWAKDSRIPTGYAATNWVENFGESGPIGLFDRYVPGGIGTIQPNWNQIFHQYATVSLNVICSPKYSWKFTTTNECFRPRSTVPRLPW